MCDICQAMPGRRRSRSEEGSDPDGGEEETKNSSQGDGQRGGSTTLPRSLPRTEGASNTGAVREALRRAESASSLARECVEHFLTARGGTHDLPFCPLCLVHRKPTRHSSGAYGCPHQRLAYGCKRCWGSAHRVSNCPTRLHLLGGVCASCLLPFNVHPGSEDPGSQCVGATQCTAGGVGVVMETCWAFFRFASDSDVKAVIASLRHREEFPWELFEYQQQVRLQLADNVITPFSHWLGLEWATSTQTRSSAVLCLLVLRHYLSNSSGLSELTQEALAQKSPSLM